MTAPLTREDLDGQTCMMPGCRHESHPHGLYLHGVCHPHADLDASYRDGVLTLRCARCTQIVTVIAVASRVAA